MFLHEESGNPSVEQLAGVTSALRQQSALAGQLKGLWKGWELSSTTGDSQTVAHASVRNASQFSTPTAAIL